jgi:hypothetical protein
VFLKILHKSMDLQFNRNCIQHNLLPIYTNIKVHDETAREEKLVLNFRKKLIER